ncbi:hypothetical protein C8054_12530 [Micromonospora sp. RP3T]|nr:hypothetical protein C8054_12530 [Micromonospora sp. RP3T]
MGVTDAEDDRDRTLGRRTIRKPRHRPRWRGFSPVDRPVYLGQVAVRPHGRGRGRGRAVAGPG